MTGGIGGPAGIIGLGSVSGADPVASGSGTILGGSVAVPGGVPGSTTLTAIMETKDARIETLEHEVELLEAELQRIKETGGRLREQLLRATAVPSGGVSIQQRKHQQRQFGTDPRLRPAYSHPSLSGQQQPGTFALIKGPSMMTSWVPYSGQTSSAPLIGSLLTGSTGVGGIGGGSSCLAGISSGATTGVVNPYTDRYSAYHPSHHHYRQQHQQQQYQQYHLQQQQQMQQHLRQIEPAAAGALALHAHTFNKHDLNFKRQVSFFINNVRIEKNDTI